MPLTANELCRLGGIIQEPDDAAESFKPPSTPQWNMVIGPDRQDLGCHPNLAPWNLVHDGNRWVLIDGDGAGPGSRLWDLAYAASTFIPFSAASLTGDQPWACLYAEGHSDHGAGADYVEAHVERWTAALLE